MGAEVTIGDGAVVAAEDGARPDGRLGSDGDVAEDHRVGVDERQRVDAGGQVTESVDGHGVTLRQESAGRNTGAGLGGT